MGMLYYGDRAEPIEFPDSLLAHLKVVITTKLRRKESFTLGWRHSITDPVGRSALWLQESIPLRFVFDTVEAGKLDSAVLQDFAIRSSSGSGLQIELDSWYDKEPSGKDQLVAVA